MPSIIIREKDNTTSPTTEYSNFSVVIPGYYDDTKENVFDDNGIYECSSQKDFEDKIGIVEPTITSVAKYADPEIINAEGTDFVSIYTKALSAEEFYRTYYKIAYTYTELAGEVDAGKLKFKYTDSNEVDHYYSFTAPVEFVDGTNYVIIKAGNEGKDAEDGDYCILGNQMAYELLGLGYTVLYKKIEEGGLDALKTEAYWECLRDRSTYDFRYITLAGYNDIDAQRQIAAIAREKIEGDNTIIGRGDCTALIDVDNSVFIDATSQKAAAKAIEDYVLGIVTADTNTAFFAPTVTYTLDNDMAFELYGGNREFPASFHYLACAAAAKVNFAEWYAVAGYTRGSSNLYVESVGYKFGDTAANILAPREFKATEEQKTFKCVNLITTERNNYYIWGNRTAKSLDDGEGLKAGHFLNVRQLCTTLKKRLYTLCKQFSFDPNSDLLWVNFCAAIRPTLDNMKTDQGIFDYRLIKVEDRQRAKLTAYVRIVPIEAVEDFDITVYLEDNLNGGVSVSTIE